MGDQLYFEDVAVGDAIPAVTERVNTTQLFFFSAATYNGHRIHYDAPYARDVEAYRGLVVHGPLLATLMLDLVRRELPGRAVRSFDYRGTAPLVAGEELVVRGEPDGGGGIRLWVTGPGGLLAMEGGAEVA